MVGQVIDDVLIIRGLPFREKMPILEATMSYGA